MKLKIFQVLFKNVKDDYGYRKVHFLTLTSRFRQAESFPEFFSIPGKGSLMHDTQGISMQSFQLKVPAEVDLLIFKNSDYGTEKQSATFTKNQ